MITADRRCDVCEKRCTVRCTGMRWLCPACWAQLLDTPWNGEPA